MWRIDPPTVSVEAVLAACVSNIADPVTKAEFLGISDALVMAEAVFWTALETTTLHELHPINSVGEVSKEEMIWLYEQKLVPAKSPARRHYDALKMAAPNGKCPLCGRGKVFSLDHHLPKTRFVDLAITPTNLIPSCQDCNKTKKNALPQLAAEETIHPYFDRIDGEVWLRARVVEVSPPALFYFADPPAAWSETLRRRVRNHFRVFELRKGYASEGANLIANIRGNLLRNVSKQGSRGIRAFLWDQAESCRDVRLNSWEAASYTALAESDWFCTTGYALEG